MTSSPGVDLSKKISTTLSKENFINVIGSEIVESWNCEEMWTIFENEKVSYNDPVKVSMMTFLGRKLSELDDSSRFDDSCFNQLYSQFLLFKKRIDGIELLRLQTIATRYFQSLYFNSIVEIGKKNNGDQLGLKISILSDTGDRKLFHVKTHSDGRLASRSSAPRRIKCRELMAYKVLQHVGFGCETHFFERNCYDVYIATLDVNSGESTNKFNEFVKLENNEEQLGCQSWGGLQEVKKDPTLNDVNYIENIIKNDKLAQNFSMQIASIDILTRIMGLHDLINNSNNFGLMTNSVGVITLKIIDFQVIDNFVELSFSEGHFRGFLKGNGMFRYSDSHRIIRYILHDRPTSVRVESALSLLTDEEFLLSKLGESIEIAYNNVCDYLTNSEEFSLNLSEMIDDLNLYNNVLKENISSFLTYLRSWRIIK